MDSIYFESIIIVTGPSFKRSTFMSAPNIPVSTTGIIFYIQKQNIRIKV